MRKERDEGGGDHRGSIEIAITTPLRHSSPDHLAAADAGRVQWVVTHPAHPEYEIRFDLVERRPHLEPQSYTPVFAPPREFACYGEPLGFTIHGPSAWGADLNGDGKPDLLGAVEWSVYPFFCHAALEMDAHPEFETGRAVACA